MGKLTWDERVAISRHTAHRVGHCVVLKKALYPLLSTGSTLEDSSQHDRKIVDSDIKDQNKRTNKQTKTAKFII